MSRCAHCGEGEGELGGCHVLEGLGEALLWTYEQRLEESDQDDPNCCIEIDSKTTRLDWGRQVRKPLQ